jgi:hypothetical protein
VFFVLHSRADRHSVDDYVERARALLGTLLDEPGYLPIVRNGNASLALLILLTALDLLALVALLERFSPA